MYRMLLMFEVLLAVTRSEATDVPLNDFIGHFEALTYNENDLISSHERLKRTVGGEKHVELKFTALDKTFHFKLYPDASIFSNDFKLGVNGRPQRNADMTVYYSGKAVGDPGTSIRGDVSHGVFVGTITTPDEEYHIEPASHHFKEEQSFHSVIYRSSDVRFDALKGKTCGLSDHAIVKKMAEDQRKAVHETDPASHTVHKRQSPNRRLTRCKLFLIGDQRFYEAVSTSSFTEAQRVTQAKAFLSRTVARVNTIYEGTVFYNNVPNGIGFEIAQIEIITQDTGFFASEFIGVQAFLERHSRPQSGDQPFSVHFPSFCAVHRFTYRDFSNGVLGLAYVAQQGTTGGICSASLNTGIVSLLNFGRRIPENINQLTFAHELGHNFGSGHDMRADATCSPGSNGGSGGNFIMFESSSSGNDLNNDNFSPCSRTSMEAIISGRAQVGPRPCFIEDPGDCGNGVLDSGEDCDCMFDYNSDTRVCNSDRCCNGSVCRLASGATCSPTVDTCCTASCMPTTDASFVCSPATECAQESRCDGSSVHCPNPDFITGVNGSTLACANNTGTCVNGTCSGSLCLLLNLEECQCSSSGEACSLCCREDSSSSTCTPVSSSTLPLAANLSNTLPPGSYCLTANDELGYCDFQQKCRPVDRNTALQRLYEFFNSVNFQNFVQWVVEMWWILVVGVLVTFGGMFLIVFICHLSLPKLQYDKEVEEYLKSQNRDENPRKGESRRRRGRSQRRVHPGDTADISTRSTYKMYEMD